MVTLQEFVPLKPAEEKLLAVASTGKQCSFGRTRPEAPAEDNQLRADFVRFLALGRDAAAAVHESGLKIQGAYIEGSVNLDGTTKVRPLWIVDCTISGEFSFADAETKVVSLDRTAVSSIRGDGVKIDGSLLLRDTLIDGSLQLFGAEIMGSLSCTGWQDRRQAVAVSAACCGPDYGDRRRQCGVSKRLFCQRPDSVRRLRNRRDLRLFRRNLPFGLRSGGEASVSLGCRDPGSEMPPAQPQW